MATKRTGWLVAAGMLLSGATGSLALAGEPEKSPSVTVTTGVITITDDPAPRDGSWQAVDASPAPVKVAAEPKVETIHVFKPAAPAVEASAACPTPGGCASGDSSFWQRCHAHMQDCWLGYRSEFSAPALGEFLYAHGKTQVAEGTKARMTLYHYDFEDGRGTLNARGRDQLAKIAALLPQNFFPVVIERTPETPGLAEARRRTVLDQLAKSPFPIPAERVIVGIPMAEGMSGVEAELIYRNLLGQTSQGGLNLPPLGIGGTGGGGTLNISAAPGAGAAPTGPSP